ncbi:MAG TPA: GDP-mannose 4,6-dehydratase, partial [Coxiellaceae bacterium]|nr:GDP-mannose 4,6-dehydratase [Coxiellaceae bacterium]
MIRYKPKNILITGAAGFIGCNFVRYMLKNYKEIHIISYDKLTYAGSLNNLDNLSNPANHVFIQGDICDYQGVSKLLRDYNIDTIVHFAAESHVDRSITGPADFIQTNIVGTFNLLEAAKHFWLDEKKLSQDKYRFHHISTDEVYGSLGPNDPAFNEQTSYAPNSPYSASKASSDHLVRAYFHTYGLAMT